MANTSNPTFLVFSTFRKSWKVAFQPFWIYLGAWAISRLVPGIIMGTGTIIGVIMTSMGGDKLPGMLITMSTVALGALVVMALQPGWYFISLQQSRGKPYTLGQILSPLDTILKMLMTIILAVLIFAVGFVCLILPGIFLMVKLQFAPFFVVDKGYGPIEALQASWEATSGSWWRIFGFDVLFGILAHIVGWTVIGVIPVDMAMWAGFALIYDSLTTREK